MTTTTVCIRDVDESTFRRFKAQSHEKGLNLGQAVSIALNEWISQQQPKKRLLSFKPIAYGKGSSDWSERVDEVIY